MSLSILSCKDDSNSDTETYPVDIAIMSPADNMTAAVGTDVHIHINFSNEGTDPTLHNVKVELLDANNAVIETLTDEHIHDMDGYYEYHNMAYTLPATAGTYTLRASSTDMMGMGDNTASSTLMVQ